MRVCVHVCVCVTVCVHVCEKVSVHIPCSFPYPFSPPWADLLKYQTDNSSDLDSIAVEVQTDAVMVLSCLCEDHMHIKVSHNSLSNMSVNQ